ncbi:MAG: RNaseH domain-containing protein [Crocosphaera sp.]
MTKSQELEQIKMYELDPFAREDLSKKVGIISLTLLIQNSLNKFALLMLSKLEVLLPQKYIQLGKAKTTATIPLVFTVPNDLPPVKVNGWTISWTNEALANFSKILEDIKQIKNLPYASWRGLLEVRLSNVTRIESEMGLSKRAINNKKNPFAYLEGGEKEEIFKKLKPILNDWLENYLASYIKKEGIDEKVIEQLRKLQEDNLLLSIEPFQSQIFPWLQHEESGTTKPKDKYSYPALADYLARLIAEHEIFTELGSIKRIITSQSGSSVQLVTNPIKLENKGLFSFFIDLEIVTFPSLPQPVIKVDVGKKRWLSSFQENSFDSKAINGFIFSENYSDRIFNFKLNRRKNKETDEYSWQPDSSFAALQRELNLPLNISNGQKIVQNSASTEDCQVLLTYRNGIQEKSHDIKVGVPEKDKLEAFKAITEILATVGIEPFKDYSKVEFRNGMTHSKNIAGSRLINTPTSVNTIFESLESKDISDSEKKSPDEMSHQEINNLLKEYFDFELSEKGIKSLRFNSKNKNQTKELTQLLSANKIAIQQLYPNEIPLLIIFHDSKHYKTVGLLKAVIEMLWEDKLEIQLQKLPKDTHGAKAKLPGNNLKSKERARKRVEAWTSVAEQIAKIERPKFCLVMADEFYPDSNDENKQLHDDNVNKPSTRRALASIGRSCVQFILPPQIWKTSGDTKIAEFIIRAQASTKELLWAHSGRIDNIQEKVDKWFGHIEPNNKPKEIIAITIVRKNAGRKRGRLERTFLPIAIRTNVKTGLSEMCCCYEDSKTDWKPFTEALFDIANISPISLGNKKNIRINRFQEFVEQIISDSVDEGNNPVVMIDSSNCVQLWDWLSDRKLNTKNIDINEHKYMQDNWQGARIVRIRQDLAPGIIEDKVKYLAETYLEDTRTKKELEADEDRKIGISAPSSPTGLYKLNLQNKTGCIVYLSIGKKTLHQKQRGASCYRKVEQDKFLKTKLLSERSENQYQKVANKAGFEMKILEKQEPYTGQLPTPNPLEIVVALRQQEDEPDYLAGFVESLRYGYGHFNEWTKLAAPLFFERVVRDYLSEFNLEEEE